MEGLITIQKETKGNSNNRIGFFFFFFNGNTKRAHCALSLSLYPLRKGRGSQCSVIKKRNATISKKRDFYNSLDGIGKLYPFVLFITVVVRGTHLFQFFFS